MLSWIAELPWGAVLPYLFIGGEWVTRIVMFVVVIRRQRAGEAVSWLLVIFLQPFIGLALYLFFTTGPIRRKRLRQHAELAAEMEEGFPLSELAEHGVEDGVVGMGHLDFVRLAERIGRMPIVGGNDARLIGETGAFVEELETLIDGAERSVHLGYYIIADDGTGERVTRALERAAARGVRCRVLADAVGSPRFLKRVAPRLRRAGIEVAGALVVKPITRPLARWDVRNHRKLAVIDGRIAVTGSHNISDAEYGQKKVGPWRDLSGAVRGPIVRELQLVFVEDWRFETGRRIDTEEAFPEVEVAGDMAMQAVPSGPGYRTQALRDLMVGAVHEANERVIVTTPYFVPDSAFLLALRLAALGGIDVRIVLPMKGNHPIVEAAGRASYGALLDAGVRIFEHNEGLLHAKTLTVDDSFGVVGSGNFDMRSFSLNFELSVLCFGAAQTGALRRVQEGYLAESEELGPERWRDRGAIRGVFEDSCRLLSPLL